MARFEKRTRALIVLGAAVLCFTAVLPGCNTKDNELNHQLKGKVTYGDAPVTGGKMFLYAESDLKTPKFQIDIDYLGNYSQGGVTKGTYKVGVDNRMYQNIKPPTKPAGQPPKDKPMPADVGATDKTGFPVYVALPKTAYDPSTSSVTIVVKGDPQETVDVSIPKK